MKDSILRLFVLAAALSCQFAWAEPFAKTDWTVRCWDGEKRLWTDRGIDAMSVAEEGGIATITNTSGVHKHAHLVMPAALEGDFSFAIELKGGYELGFLNREGKDEMLYVELGDETDWETFVLTRKGTRYSIERNGRVVPLVHFRFDYGDEVIITLAIKEGEKASIRSCLLTLAAEAR